MWDVWTPAMQNLSRRKVEAIINDHLETCPRYAVVNAVNATVRKRRFRESGVVDFSV